MAHLKIAATTVPIATPAMIKFSFEQEKLFAMTSLQTTYMTKQMIDKSGRNIGEEFAMSEDERDAFNISLEATMSEMFEIFLKQTAGVTQAYKIDNEAKTVNISILDYAAYNDNVLDLVDMAIKECILAGCIKGWFETCSNLELFKLANEKYIMQQEVLKRRLFQLKKKRAYSS